MKSPSTVYIVQAPRASVSGHNIDLSSAADFGRIEFLLPSYSQPSLDPQKALEALRRGLANFGPDDYIASVGGDPAGIFLAGIVLPEMCEGPIKWLRWERHRDKGGNRDGTGFYIPTEIDHGYDDEE